MKNTYNKLGEEFNFRSRTKKTYKIYENGKFNQKGSKKFLEDLGKW